MKELMASDEGIKGFNDDGTLNFDFNVDSEGDIIPLSFKSMPSGKITKKGISVYVPYHLIKTDKLMAAGQSKQDARDYLTKIRHAIKHLPNNSDKENVIKMIDNSIVKLNKIFPLDMFDLIVASATSAPLNNLILDRMKQFIGGAKKPLIVKDAFVKDVMQNLQVNWDVVERENNPDTKARVTSLLQNLQSKHRLDQPFQAKYVGSSWRRYFKNFIKFNDNVSRFVFQAAVGGYVLVVDDSIGEAVTLEDTVRNIKQYNPNQIYAFAFIKDY